MLQIFKNTLGRNWNFKRDALVQSLQSNFLIFILLLQLLENNIENPLKLMISGALAYISTPLHIKETTSIFIEYVIVH